MKGLFNNLEETSEVIEVYGTGFLKKLEMYGLGEEDKITFTPAQFLRDTVDTLIHVRMLEDVNEKHTLPVMLWVIFDSMVVNCFPEKEKLLNDFHEDVLGSCVAKPKGTVKYEYGDEKHSVENQDEELEYDDFDEEDADIDILELLKNVFKDEEGEEDE